MEVKLPPLLAKSLCKEVSTKSLYYDKAIFVFLCMEDIKNPIDLGHDDVDGQECKDGRSRTWMVLLYEDDPTHKAVLDGKFAELDWNYAGRIHDQDDGVKPHHHVVCLFKDGRKAADVAADLGLDMRWLRAWDRNKKALRYLCHRDNPEKFQYHPDGIYGTIAEKAVAACSKGDALSENQSMQEVIKTLDEIEGYISYKVFLSLMVEKGCFAVFRRLGVLGVKLIDEHNYEYSLTIKKEITPDLSGYSDMNEKKIMESDKHWVDKCIEADSSGNRPMQMNFDDV